MVLPPGVGDEGTGQSSDGSLPNASVKSELEAFGMWDDPSRFLNTEYVEGTTNVTAYDKNFLAIHGLNQFYQKVLFC